MSSSFQTTRWSVIDRVKLCSEEKGDALQEICRSYWKPVYAFIRRAGSNPEEAEDLTQEFFAEAIRTEFFEKADQTRGRLRSYVLGSVKNFTNKHYRKERAQKRGGDVCFVFINQQDGEKQFSFDPEDKNLSPEAMYDKVWALSLLSKSLDILRDEYQRKDREKLFSLLSPLITESKKRGDLTSIAHELDCSPGAARLAFQRFKNRFGEIVRMEITGTIGSEESVEEELLSLKSILS